MLTLRAGAVAALALVAGAAPAAAAPEPIDGTIQYITAVHPFTGLTQNAVGAYAGYLGELDASFPRVGDVFYLHGVVAVTGTLPDTPIPRFVADAFLTPDIELAISPQHPVRCYFYPRLDRAPEPDPESCNQTPLGTLGTGAFFGGRLSMEPGEGFEVQVPVRVLRPKAGLGSGRAAQFGFNIVSSYGEATAVQHLVVAPAATTGGGPTGAPAPPASAAGDRRAPRAGALRAVSGRRTARGRLVRLRLRLNEPARVTVALQRRARPGAPFRAARRPVTRRMRAGLGTVPIGPLRAGTYRAVLRLRDAAGNRSAVRTTFTVRR